MKNHSTQKGSLLLLILAIIVVLILGAFMFFYIYNQIKSEASDEELKNKEVTPTQNTQNTQNFFNQQESSPKGMRDIKVYFPKKDFNNCTRDINKEHFDSFNRTVKDTMNLSYVALEELFKGPTEEEKSKGYWTDIADGVSIGSISVSSGRAEVDLNEKIKDNPSSCGEEMRYWQMKLTLTQFPNISAAVFTVNGDPKTSIQP